jgi:lipopolysaccharide transport protein LptA
MRWQRAAQAAIAVFVVGFLAVLFVTLRKESRDPVAPPPLPQEKTPEGANTVNLGGCDQVSASGGKRIFSLKCDKHFAFPDGRQQLSGNVQVSLPRNDREFLLIADEAEVKPKDGTIERADFKGNVRVTTESGLLVTAGAASYNDADGIVTIPGPVEFSKGRMKGAGVGATYDRNRETLWIQDKARIDVAPDAGAGQQRMEGTANRIGLARADHFLRLEGNGRIVSEGRTLEADDIVIRLTPDDERITGMELRGNSRIAGGAGGPQNMSARDIDLAYAEDGRTLQRAVLTENAAVQLAAAGGGKRISGALIDMTLGPDGSTVTGLSASGKVVVDLPPEKASPGKQIRAATLTASGAPDAGLQSATFGGGVQYRESRPAARGVAGLNRTANSDTLILATAPGLGAIEQADFRGNVSFTDGTDFFAEAPQALYGVARERLDLSPGDGYPGKPPLVRDERISIAARTIGISLPTRDLSADTRVRSTMAPQKEKAKPGAERQLPSVLKEGETVYVTSNRLEYKGKSSQATYTGNAVLWQGEKAETQIKGDTLVIDDRMGNLTAAGSVTTQFIVEETDQKTGTRKPTQTRGSADRFTYDDKQRLATYETKARLISAQGDVTGDKIELFMKAEANELERAEAYGTVTVKEGQRIAKGARLTYTAATDEYLMSGAPVEIIEARKDGCIQTLAATARFNRTSEDARVDGNQVIATRQQSIPCPAGLKR